MLEVMKVGKGSTQLARKRSASVLSLDSGAAPLADDMPSDAETVSSFLLHVESLDTAFASLRKLTIEVEAQT